MFETMLDIVLYGGVGFAVGWLGPARPEKVTQFYTWIKDKLPSK